MTTIITRSALVFHGHDPAPDVASIVVDHEGRHVVTWSDVMAARRERQAAILQAKRAVREVRAHRVWVAYFDQPLMGGWQAFVEDFRGRYGVWRNWIDRDRRGLIPHLMRLFPLVLRLGRDEREWFDDWKAAFAAEYRAGSHDGRPRGCAFVWWDGRDDLRFAGRPAGKGATHAR